MAKGYYQNLYDSLFKGDNKLVNSVGKSDVDKLQRSIDIAKTKIDAAGADSSTDSRNPLEKFLGLPEDQNFVFDIFELLGRPQQAVFGAIDAKQRGQDASKAAMEGLTGQKYTTGGQLLRNAGIGDDKEGAATIDPRTWGIDDVAGFALDLFADPIDLALIPVTGGASAAIGASADAGKTASKAVKAIDTTVNTAKVADKAVDAAKNVSKIDKALNAMDNLEFKSLTSVAFDSAGKLIKKTGKVADTGIEKWLKYLDNTKGIEYANPLAKKAGNLGKNIDNLVEGASSYGKLEQYKDIKDIFSRAFSTVASVPSNVRNAINKNNANSIRAAKELDVVYKELDDGIAKYATKLAREAGDMSDESIAKIASKVDEALLDIKEFKNLDRTVKISDLIDEAKSGKLLRSSIDDETFKILNSVMDDVNLADRGVKLTMDVTDNGLIKLNKDWDYVYKTTNKEMKKLAQDHPNLAKSIEGVTLDPEKLNIEVKKLGTYTDDDLKYINEYIQRLDPNSPMFDADFAELYNISDNVFNKSNSILDKYFDTNLATKYGDNLGYVRHAYDSDAYNAYSKAGIVAPYGQKATKGNARILSDRLYNMSVREANNIVLDDLRKNVGNLNDKQLKALERFNGIFKTGMLASFDDYLKNVPQLAQDSKLIDEVLVKATFGNNSEINKLTKQIKKAINNDDLGLVEMLNAKKTELLNNSNMKILTSADNNIPRGFTQITKDEADKLYNKMIKISDELGLKDMKKAANTLKKQGSKMAVNQDLIRLIGINTDKAGRNGLVRLYDKYMSFFKQNKVLSPTFQMNNLIGNSFNMYLGGISPTRQAELFPQAVELLAKKDDLMTKFARNEVLTARESKLLNIWNEFIDAGFGDPKSLTALDLADMPEGLKKYFDGTKSFKDMSTLKQIKDFLPYFNNKLNNYFDTTSRLVTFMEGYNNPYFLRKLGVETAGDAVRKINFDPRDLTSFENSVMKRIVPFYTFTKKNLAYQISNLGKNGERYHRLMKGYNQLMDASTGDNSETVQDWIKNNLYIPIPGLGKNGEYKILRATIPFGNLVDTASDPIGAIANLVTPAARVPFELTTNMNTFNSSPIESFEGQRSKNIPLLTKKQEYLLSNLTGLDTPAKVATRLLSGEGDDIYSRIGSGLMNSVTMDQSVENDKLSKMYDELDELETMMKQYEQDGYEFSTLNELKKANSNSIVSSIMAQLNKLDGIKNNPYGYN